MQRYEVLETRHAKPWLALRDDSGRVHVAFAQGKLPPPGTLLLGETPKIGPRSLRSDDGCHDCLVIFVLQDCHEQVAVKLIRSIDS
jgi:hypothetical protein